MKPSRNSIKENIVMRKDLHDKLVRVAEAAGYARNAVVPALLAALTEDELVAHVKDAVARGLTKPRGATTDVAKAAKLLNSLPPALRRALLQQAQSEAIQNLADEDHQADDTRPTARSPVVAIGQ